MKATMNEKSSRTKRKGDVSTTYELAWPSQPTGTPIGCYHGHLTIMYFISIYNFTRIVWSVNKKYNRGDNDYEKEVNSAIDRSQLIFDKTCDLRIKLRVLRSESLSSDK